MEGVGGVGADVPAVELLDDQHVGIDGLEIVATQSDVTGGTEARRRRHAAADPRLAELLALQAGLDGAVDDGAVVEAALAAQPEAEGRIGELRSRVDTSCGPQIRLGAVKECR